MEGDETVQGVQHTIMDWKTGKNTTRLDNIPNNLLHKNTPAASVHLITYRLNYLNSFLLGPRLNGQVLAEFSRVQETAPEPSLRVKSATLWIYVQLNGSSTLLSQQQHVHQQQQQQRTSRSPTLYVFRLLSSQEPFNNASSDNNKVFSSHLIITFLKIWPSF